MCFEAWLIIFSRANRGCAFWHVILYFSAVTQLHQGSENRSKELNLKERPAFAGKPKVQRVVTKTCGVMLVKSLSLLIDSGFHLISRTCLQNKFNTIESCVLRHNV